METVDYHFYIHQLGFWIQQAVFILFILACYLLWWQTHRISPGHYLIGLITIIILIIGSLLMAFGPERVTLFRILVYGSLTIWLTYNGWYFRQFPIPVEHLRAVDRYPPPTEPHIIPKNALLRYLSQAEKEERRPSAFSKAFQYGLLAIGILLLVVFGFSQSIKSYTLGMIEGRRLQLKQAVVSRTQIEAITRKQLSAVVDSIQEGQLKLSKEINRKPRPVIEYRYRTRSGVKSGPTRPVRLNVEPIQPRLLPGPGGIRRSVDSVRAGKSESWFDRIFSGPTGRLDSLRLGRVSFKRVRD